MDEHLSAISAMISAMISANLSAPQARLVSRANPRTPPVLIARREVGVRYFVEQLDPSWLLLVHSANSPRNSPSRSASAESALSLSVAALPTLPSRATWTSLYTPPRGEYIEDVDVFSRHVALYTRTDAIPGIRIIEIERSPNGSPNNAPGHLPSAGAARRPRVAREHRVTLPTGGDPCAISPASNHSFGSSTCHFHLSSPSMPRVHYAYDMAARKLRARAPAEPPVPKAPMTTQMRRADVTDGTAVPVTVVHAADASRSAEQVLARRICFLHLGGFSSFISADCFVAADAGVRVRSVWRVP